MDARRTFNPPTPRDSPTWANFWNRAVWRSDFRLRNTRKSPPRCRIGAVFLFACVVAQLSGCFGGSSVRTRVVSDPPASPQADPYTIGPDDVLDLLVWKEPQLSGRVRVASDGTVTMPLIGQLPASDQTTQQLQNNLTDKLSKFVHDPKVTVRVYNPASCAFYALGEVTKPGRYPLMSGEVLSQALAAAGGPTEYANLRKIKIVRRNSTSEVEITVDYSAVKKGDLSADVPLRRADTIMVP
jgi:polysaccharide biosynthesis/export protein